MKMSNALRIVAAVSLGLTTSVFADLRLPSPELETLPNGLQIAWFLDQKLPVIDLGLLVKTGTREDPIGKSGLALLTASALERGAGTRNQLEFSRAFENLGGSFSASVDEDAISIAIHGLSTDTPQLLDLLADSVLLPKFDDAEIQRVKEQEKEKWEHLGDSAESLASFTMARWMSRTSPYARGSLYSIPEWMGLSGNDVRSFYQARMTPDQAILMVVGRGDRASIRAQIAKRFADWKKVPAPAGASKKAASLEYPKIDRDAKLVVVDRPGLPQAQVRFGFPIPSIYSKNRYALAVSNALLGEYFNSRLNSVIRDELGLAYGVGSSLSYAKELSYLTIASATALQHTPILIREVQKILDSLKRGELLDEEVQTSKSFLIGGYPMSVSTLGAVASRWLAGNVYGLGPDFLNEYIPEVQKVDRKRAIDAIQEAFRLDQMKIVIAGDASKIAPLLAKFGWKNVKVLRAPDLMDFRELDSRAPRRR